MKLGSDKRLSPNKEFYVRLFLEFGELRIFSPVLKFTTPRALRRVRDLTDKDFFRRGHGPVTETTSNTTIWSVIKYRKVDGGSNNKKIQLRISESSQSINPIKTGNRISFSVPSGSPLASLTNANGYSVIERNVGGKRLDIKVSDNTFKNITGNPGAWLPGSNLSNNNISLTGGVTKKQLFAYSANISGEISEGLVRKGNVEDIMVFAYEQYDGQKTAEVKRYYMRHHKVPLVDKEPVNVVVGKNPPSYSRATRWFTTEGRQRRQSRINLDRDLGRNIAFYCTPVRYIKNSEGVWKGSWLQKNQAGNPVWSRPAKPGGDN